MKMQLLRNATLIIEINNKKVLVDPMLGPKGIMDPFPWTDNNLRNPLVDVPTTASELKLIMDTIDAIFITHLHPDHFDETAMVMLKKDIPVFCQPGDAPNIKEAGFLDVNTVEDELEWNEVQIFRTGGHHGTGETEVLMGKVSGFVLKRNKETIYIAGDTILCEEVEDALIRFKPQHVVLNGGAATFINGNPVTMTVNDIVNACNFLPDSRFYVVHLEALNHCKENRQVTKSKIYENGLLSKCIITDDG